MPKPVYVAIWHLDTRADPGPNEPDWKAKLATLRAQVASADNQFRQFAATHGEVNPIKIFLAPEYYFAMGGDYIRGYSLEEAIEIRFDLKMLSNQFPDILIVPGTIAWKQLLDRNQRSQVASQLQQVMHDHSAQGRHRVTTPAGATRGSDGIYAAEVKQAYDNIKLKGKNRFGSKTKTRWFGYNTAYVYFRGLQIAEINKATDAGEFTGDRRDGDEVVMIPGFRSGAFEVHGLTGVDGVTPLRVGVEICADHSRLGNTFKERVDIHVLISASQRAGSPASRGDGLFFHCDNQEPPGVFRGVAMDGTPPWVDRQAIRDAANTHSAGDLHVQRTILN